MRYKIKQIIPAQDWFAVHEYTDQEHYSRIACWALVEDEDGNTFVDSVEVEGGDGVTDLSSNLRSFKRYVHNSDLIPL